ncbi:MAG: TfoX/Sxy family protein [Actinomycetia bacterium]|nr:TfoX/Sxy family protein [Actinomycetes bacterium]MCP4223965.1 TfoX/Sxy family protein [Actinomycetes bacterium]MCP5034030.1 TfoX/Sxy family protein [Actinomycetes bacterium]
MAKAKYEGPPDALASYEALVEGNTAVDRKGAKVPYTSRNGHMFSFLDATGSLAIRLPADLRDEFLASYDTQPVEQYGTVMKEYVAIPPSLLADTPKLREWFDASHDWIGTLEPKATTRPKNTKKKSKTTKAK